MVIWGGRAEIALRKCLVERYKREEYVIADKLTLSKMVEFESLEEYFLVQLRNLGVDFIDLYLIHGLDAEKYKYISL